MPPFVETDAQRNRRVLANAVKLPTVSGRLSALCLFVCFLVTAAFVPMIFHWPVWINFEIIIALWWIVWFAALTWMLYVGWHVVDDHTWTGPRSWLPSFKTKGKKVKAVSKSESSEGSFVSGIGDLGDFDGDGEGCVWVLGIIAALCLLYFAAWFLVELAIPALAFLLYFAIRGMLASAVNDGGAFRGKVLPCLAIALFWATLYTAPVAGAVWLIHKLVPSQSVA